MSQAETTNQIEAGGEMADHGTPDPKNMYLRFGAMILTSMAFMFGVMYLHTYELSHVQWSETRFFMTLLMGATMALVMLAFMLSMYEKRKWNLAIVAGAVVLFGAALWLVRSQDTVDDTAYMSAMIPHHSIAILTSERSQIEDVRVCELAVAISEAQRREIAEMEWLITDIGDNGVATNAAEAESRPVPHFPGESRRSCS